MMYLSITFDYELFFGNNNGSYDDVLFGPTYELIDMLKEKGLSATFFADVCSIPMAQKYNQINYINGFNSQIQYMVKHGQDVQLHLHPHWFYSSWENGQWSFSNKGYRLHDFIEDGRMNSIISDGIQYLNEQIKPIKPQYECIAYRAGGFSMQPHGKIVEALYDQGIRVDSSVAPQLVTESEANFYDYRHPLEVQNWYLSDSTEWWENSTGGKALLEIPVATIDKSPLSFIVRRLVKPNTVKLNLGPKRGSYIAIHTRPESKLKSYYHYFTGFNAISMDAYAAEFLYSQVQRLRRKVKGENQVVAIIGHPKLVNNVYIENLMRFIDMIDNDSNLEFISIYDAYQMKEKENGAKEKVQ